MIKTKEGKKYAKQLEKLDKEILIETILFQEEIIKMMTENLKVFGEILQQKWKAEKD